MVFRGWIVLACCAAGVIAASAGHSFMMGPYIESFMADLDLSRSTVSGLWSGSLVVSSLYVNVIGRVVDAYGAPFVIRCAVVPYGLAVASLSLATSAETLVVAFVATRCLGPETLDFAFRNCVAQWFNSKRGRATGLLNAAGALMMVLPACVGALRAALGWRRAARLWGLGAALLAALSALPLVRRPEDIGQRPDGAAAAAEVEMTALGEDGAPLLGDDDETARAPCVGGFTLAEALRTRGYWMLQFYNIFGCLPWQGVNFHMAAILAENGFPEASLPYVYMPLAAASCVGSGVGGVLLDALTRRRQPLLALLLPTVTAAAALSSHFFAARFGTAGLVFFGGSLGLFQGSTATIMSVLPANLFGREHLGKITASMYISAQLTSAAGSAVFGVAKDAAGTFRPLFRVLIAGLVIQGAAVVADGIVRSRGAPKKAAPA